MLVKLVCLGCIWMCFHETYYDILCLESFLKPIDPKIIKRVLCSSPMSNGYPKYYENVLDERPNQNPHIHHIHLFSSRLLAKTDLLEGWQVRFCVFLHLTCGGGTPGITFFSRRGSVSQPQPGWLDVFFGLLVISSTSFEGRGGESFLLKTSML